MDNYVCCEPRIKKKCMIVLTIEGWERKKQSSRFHRFILLTVDDRPRPEERRRNELYRQYYEEIQRRYDTDRPVDCSVIVVNKAQK